MVANALKVSQRMLVRIQPINIDQNAVNYYASHKITSVTRCDESGSANGNGAYSLIECEDLDSGREYEGGVEYRFVASQNYVKA